MGEIKETYTRYECDLCGKEIDLKHPHTIKLTYTREKKYLCHDCLNEIVQSIGQEDIEYYFKEDQTEESRYDKKTRKKV